MTKPHLSRIDGQLDRSFPAQIRVLTREDDAERQSENVRLELTFSSETPYLRSSWFDEPWVEVLGHQAGECDLSRLNSGAPVLANHDRRLQAGSPLASIGVVDSATVEGGVGRATLTLSRRDGL